MGCFPEAPPWPDQQFWQPPPFSGPAVPELREALGIVGSASAAAISTAALSWETSLAAPGLDQAPRQEAPRCLGPAWKQAPRRETSQAWPTTPFEPTASAAIFNRLFACAPTRSPLS